MFGYDNMIILNDSKVNVNFGRFEKYYAQNLTIFTVNNSTLILENSIFSDFASILIYSSIGFIGIDSCNFTNAFVSFSKVNSYVVKLENQVSFIIRNSQFQFLRKFDKVSIIFFILTNHYLNL